MNNTRAKAAIYIRDAAQDFNLSLWTIFLRNYCTTLPAKRLPSASSTIP